MGMEGKRLLTSMLIKIVSFCTCVVVRVLISVVKLCR